MEEDVLLKNIIQKIDAVNKISTDFFKNDFEKINPGKFKYTILSLNNFFIKIGFLNNAILNCYSTNNFYVMKILNRTLIEAYFKHLYIFSRSLKENSDDVGKEYIYTLKASEDLSAIKLLSNFIKESNITLNKNITKWSFGGEHNEKIKNIAINFDLKHIFNYLLKNLKLDDNKNEEDNNKKDIIKNAFRDDFFKKYIREYNDSSSFIHAGSYSDKVFEAFQLSENKKDILDQSLEDSFSLYRHTVCNTYLFYSLMDNKLDSYYQEINKLFKDN